MGKRNRIRIADVAREAGLTELEAIERLRQNGVTAREGYRISSSDLKRVRKILSGGDGDVDATQEMGAEDGLTTTERRARHLKVGEAVNSAVEDKPTEEQVRVIDVVEEWLAENPEPKHFTVAGRTFEDVIGSCYQYLLAYARRRGVTSTDILVGRQDRRQIEAFLYKVKARWDSRRREEQAKAEALREAEERRKAEERQRIDELNRLERERQLRLLQEDQRRLEEKRLRDEALRQAEERRTAEARRQWAAQRKADEHRRLEAKRQAELSIQRNEQARIRQILSAHQQAVRSEGNRLMAGQCSWSDYYAFILRDRIERSAELLFGSAQQPSYEILRANPELLEKLKGNLSFAEDRHPNSYQDPYVNAYYALRYEIGYAFEYSQIYEMVLSIMRQKCEEPLLDVLSIGSGQGLDYWGLCYALSKQWAYRPRIGWHGVDLETWPDHILNDGLAQYSDGTDVRELLSSMNKLEAKVLMFPKVISELPYEVINSIASWLERVTLTRDVHYLCFAHTKRESFGSSKPNQGITSYRFHGVAESSPAVKSAALIKAACNSSKRQSYEPELDWCDSSTMRIGYYDVIWSNAQTNSTFPGPYRYLVYEGAGGGNWQVWRNDPTFYMDEQLRRHIKGIGSACCGTRFIASQDDYGNYTTDCATGRVGCNNSSFCPLHRWPRFMTGGIAYQIVRLVRQPNYDNDIPF